ncbi:MAG: hypothetical protein WC289_05400 [Patescibacteria group bacterium]|jgi:hypothetical protein
MNQEKPRITFTSPIEEDPTYTDPEEIAHARQALIDLDTHGKLFIAPNQPTKGELEMWATQLFEPRDELNGKSAYDFFDKIIFGHGEGPANIGDRQFKAADQLEEKYQGTMNKIIEREASGKDKVLVVVCGTTDADKMTLSDAIREYMNRAQ